MSDIDWENDPEFQDMMREPVTEEEFQGTLFAFAMKHFARYIPNDVIGDLAKAGIVIRRGDNIALQSALKTFHQGPSVHYSAEALAREERIASLAVQLKKELAPDLADDNEPVREYWGDYVDPDEPEPYEYLYLKQFDQDLDLLARSALEKAAWLLSAKAMEVEPGSNRADRNRYFYWLILLGFWKYILKRDIGTSSNGENDGSGPLVKFLQVMSKGGGLEFNEVNSNAVRSWIRRNADKVETVAYLFDYYRR